MSINLWSSPDRIPLLYVAQNGNILAFAENRIDPQGNSDTGYINCVVKVSTNGGSTFGSQTAIATDGVNTHSVGAVVMNSAGKLFFFAGWNLYGDDENEINAGTGGDTRRVYLTTSTDHGVTWSGLTEVTSSTKSAGWRWISPGPNPGIRLASGRLLVPFYHTGTSSDYHPHVVYSDDDGTTWHVGGSISGSGYSESSIVQLHSGSIMMLSRPDANGKVAKATSTDEGATWSSMSDTTLNDSSCQSACVRYTEQPQYGTNRLLFSNPPNSSFFTRTHGTMFISYDEGSTWPVSKQYFPNNSGYSSIAILPDKTIGTLTENGSSTYFDHITFDIRTLSDLSGGTDALDPVQTQQFNRFIMP